MIMFVGINPSKKEIGMRWEKFTVKAQEAVSEAQKKTEELGQQAIETEKNARQ